MSTKNEVLYDVFTRWMDRYSPRRALQQNETALKDEVNALMRVIWKMAPREDYENWLAKVLNQLDYQMKTSAWPTVAEIGAACSNQNKARILSNPLSAEPFSLDPVKIAAKRMNAGESVGDAWLYGRNSLDLMATGLVTGDTLRRYRSALYFSAKDTYGEGKAKRMEAEWLLRHGKAENLHAVMAAADLPEGEPFKRMPTHPNDGWAA
tara:strand:- start:1361 stop:1984 length:624 start_codon:yes stop_codon:yes gene_type:complete